MVVTGKMKIGDADWQALGPLSVSEGLFFTREQVIHQSTCLAGHVELAAAAKLKRDY